jgi:hypothetical protein
VPVESGESQKVSIKISKGEDAGWRMRGFIAMFGAAMKACGAANL